MFMDPKQKIQFWENIKSYLLLFTQNVTMNTSNVIIFVLKDSLGTISLDSPI